MSIKTARHHVVTALFAIIQAEIVLAGRYPRFAGRLRAIREMLHELQVELRK